MSRQSGLIPNGKSTITAVAHRKQASVTGGMEPESIRATMKLPDQIPVAVNASTYPMAGFDGIDPDARMSPSLKETGMALSQRPEEMKKKGFTE